MTKSCMDLLPQSSTTDPWDEVFADLPIFDEFENSKKIEIAVELSALLAKEGISRVRIAEKLGWEKSRVTRVLSGKTNLTVKTIFEFCKAAGYDFDLHFRKPNELPCKKPWNVGLMSLGAIISVQSPAEVLDDFVNGRQRPLYLSLDVARNTVKNMGPADEVIGIDSSPSMSFSLNSLSRYTPESKVY